MTNRIVTVPSLLTMRPAPFNPLTPLLFCMAVSASAAGQVGFDRTESADRLVTVRVVADAQPIAPGQTFHLAFIFEIRKHWHIYWINPGASGAPPSITIAAPAGYETGPTLFTRPQAIGSWDDDLGVTYGYEDRAVLFVPVTAPKDMTSGEATFRADVKFLVCREKCLMGNVTRSITVATTSQTDAATARPDPVIAEAMSQLPRPIEDLPGAAVRLSDSTLIITAPAGDATTATLFPIEMPGVTFGRPRITIERGVLTASVDVEVRPQNARGEPLRIAGVLGLGEKRSDPSFTFELPPPDS